MTRYTELRHSGYYQSHLTDEERQKIADEVDSKSAPKDDPKPKTARKTKVG